MGFFSRGNQDDANSSDFLDDVELPSSDDLNENLFSNTDSQPSFRPSATKPSAAQRPIGSSRYGIEDAIKLMRSLPRDNNEVVVTVVKKTLESTDIQVPDIIDDANAKEERIRNEHKTLETEIKELQDQIARRNHQISDLLKDLKETTDVRQRLQLALDLDRKQHPEPAPQRQPAPQSEGAPAHNANPQTAADVPGAQQASAKQPAAGQAAPNQTAPNQTAFDNNARRRAGHRVNLPPNH